ncbi:DUF6479 family protein [Streptomyces sp. NPDC046887]|uniref:DUF6479 family protein n=1 Tax=Streptomyces sp. NPDC046887 TaxID=3155472 RepID=UPI0033E4BF98
MDSLTVFAAEYALRDHLVGIGPLVAGILLVGFLVGGFLVGRRIRQKESPAPRPEEQPHRPDDAGIPGETEGHRRPAELEEREDRLMPYEVKTQSTEADSSPVSEHDAKWRGSHSGSWGAGGPGAG